MGVSVPGLLEAFGKLLPPQALLTSPTDRAPYETDWRRLYANPALCVVLPASREQVAGIVEICTQRGIAIVPQGGNTGLVAGAVPIPGRPQIILSLKRMSAIRGLDPLGATITVEAGATLHEVQEAAAAQGQLFPISLGAEGTAQIGGLISTNAGGVQVLSYGSMREQVLGLEVVLADGRIWHGLRALRKDNTGFDMKQIFIGAEGCLGIITAAVLRLRPAIAARATALIGVADAAAALALFIKLREGAAAMLTLCEYISRQSMDLAIAHMPQTRLPFEAGAYVLAEIATPAASEPVQERLESLLASAIESSVATDAVIAQSERERLQLLSIREMVPEAELQEGGAVKHDIAVPIPALPATIGAIEALAARDVPAMRLHMFGHIGDGNLHVNLRPPAGRSLQDLGGTIAVMTAAIETLAVAQGGSFSAEHGIGQMRRSGMALHKSAEELGLMRQLKAAFDPHDLLNPGKLLPA